MFTIIYLQEGPWGTRQSQEVLAEQKPRHGQRVNIEKGFIQGEVTEIVHKDKGGGFYSCWVS